MTDTSRFAALYKQARDHDGDAFLGVMRGVEDALRRYVPRHMSRALAARLTVDDVVQDVWLLVFERIERFSSDLDEAEFNSYVLQIARHQLVDLARAHASHAQQQPLSDDPTASASRTGSVTKADDRRKLREAVDKLPADQAAIVRAIVYEGSSVRAAARAHAITEDVVRQRLVRARARLRELFGIETL
jgi:RNA polymerase sigma-70 factor, ECF subfamily